MLGFIGCPWTLATYVVEGHSTTQYKTIKTMAYQAPDVLDALLSHTCGGPRNVHDLPD